MASRTIYDCDSCKSSDIQPIRFAVPVIRTEGSGTDDYYMADTDVCPGCAERLLKSMMGGLDATQGTAIFKAITKSK